MDFSGRDEWEARIAGGLGKLGEKQRRDIVRLLGNPPDLANVTPQYWQQYRAELTALLVPDLEAIYLESATEFMASEPVFGVDWGLVNKEATRWAKEYGFDLVGGLTDTTREGLQELVPQFFEEDMSIGELRERLGRWFGPSRASTIATTEVTRAASEGEVETGHELREQGIDMVPVWNTNNDEIVRECPICWPLHEEEAAGIDGGGRPYWIHPVDGQQYGPPPAHPNDRCWVSHELRQ